MIPLLYSGKKKIKNTPKEKKKKKRKEKKKEMLLMFLPLRITRVLGALFQELE